MATKQNIAIPLIPTPRGVQVPIQAMQQVLGALPWLQFAYGEAFKGIKEVDGSRYTTPQVYVQGREWLNLEPDDTVSAFSFFEVPEDKANINGSNTFWNQPISLVVYCNLEIIDQVEGLTRDWIYTEELIEETTALLNSSNLSFIVDDTLTVERHIAKAFSEYSYWTFDERYIKRNYDAFKFNFVVQLSDQCPL